MQKKLKVHPNNVSIGLINPKSPSNVGAVMRAAGCFQVNSVFYTGERFNRAAKFNTDTYDIRNTIPLTCVENLLSCAEEEQKVVCVELVEGATALPQFIHPNNVIYIFGSEDGSISQKMINVADDVIYIPTIGSMNLAQTVNVALYDRLAKSNKAFEGDELIKRSRDTNNKLKFTRSS